MSPSRWGNHTAFRLFTEFNDLLIPPLGGNGTSRAGKGERKLLTGVATEVQDGERSGQVCNIGRGVSGVRACCTWEKQLGKASGSSAVQEDLGTPYMQQRLSGVQDAQPGVTV